MDTRLYLDANRLMTESAFAHALARAFASWGFLALSALVVVVAYWRARSGRTGGGTRQLAGSIWSLLAAAAAFGLAELVAIAVGRPRPYEALPQAVVLVHRVTSSGLPAAPAALAAAVAIACFLGRDPLLGALGALVALATAFDEVYVGANYPGDVLAGLGLGLVVALVGAPLLSGALEAAVRLVGHSPLGGVLAPGAARRRPSPFAAGAGTAGTAMEETPSAAGSRATAAGPAGRPPTLTATGAVRVLEDKPLSPRPRPPGGGQSATAGAVGPRSAP